jgi:hypothetical protein
MDRHLARAAENYLRGLAERTFCWCEGDFVVVNRIECRTTTTTLIPWVGQSAVNSVRQELPFPAVYKGETKRRPMTALRV